MILCHYRKGNCLYIYEPRLSVLFKLFSQLNHIPVSHLINLPLMKIIHWCPSNKKLGLTWREPNCQKFDRTYNLLNVSLACGLFAYKCVGAVKTALQPANIRDILASLYNSLLLWIMLWSMWSIWAAWQTKEDTCNSYCRLKMAVCLCACIVHVFLLSYF